MSTTSPSPDPMRPLGAAGLDTWKSLAGTCPPDARHLLQMLCEQMDERAGLRVQVLRAGNPSDRRALRSLDRQISENLQVVMDAIRGSELEVDAFDLLAAELSAAVGDAED